MGASLKRLLCRLIKERWLWGRRFLFRAPPSIRRNNDGEIATFLWIGFSFDKHKNHQSRLRLRTYLQKEMGKVLNAVVPRKVSLKSAWIWIVPPRYAGVVQWQNTSLPNWLCGFDSHHLLQLRCCQVVRQRTLTPLCVGSIPTTAAVSLILASTWRYWVTQIRL